MMMRIKPYYSILVATAILLLSASCQSIPKEARVVTNFDAQNIWVLGTKSQELISNTSVI